LYNKYPFVFFIDDSKIKYNNRSFIKVGRYYLFGKKFIQRSSAQKPILQTLFGNWLLSEPVKKLCFFSGILAGTTTSRHTGIFIEHKKKKIFVLI
jgi:hypothetical protein